MRMLTIRQELIALGTLQKAEHAQRFFKTAKGQYGYGDKFLGIVVPEIRRQVAKYWKQVSPKEVAQFVADEYHEIRLFALLVWVRQFDAGDEATQKLIFSLYVENIRYVNNWDLVDLSTDRIVGEFLYGKEDGLLDRWAKSSNLWQRRMAVLATFANIRHGDAWRTFVIAKTLLHDEHDLIHKAVGWILREAGKRVSQEQEEVFLLQHYKTMPRTMLRYAIERFEEGTRQQYLRGAL